MQIHLLISICLIQIVVYHLRVINLQLNYMRKGAFTQRDQTLKGRAIYPEQVASDYLNSYHKMQKNGVQAEGLLSIKNRYQQNTFQRNRLSPKRPISTNRTYSFTQPKKQDRNLSRGKDQQREEEQKNMDKKKGLWVSTMKEPIDKKVEQENSSKGKLFRGTSWRQDKRNSFNYRKQTPFVESKDQRTSTEKTYRLLRKGGYKNHLIDLIGRNLDRSPQNDSNFFQYVMRFSYRTRKGHIPSNPAKVNQDSFIIAPNINNKSWQHLFGICDGHGPLGHYVSAFIKNNLGNAISSIKSLQKSPKEALIKGFNNTYQKLLKQSKIDMNFSGSTVISCYLFQNKLYCSNVGDSRAILGKQSKNQRWKAEALSTDHKPSLQSEANRIRSMNGRVEAFRDEYGDSIGPLRVWLKEENVPGLAMTRSFGDLVAASVGVSALPQIKEYNLSQEDKIILIASDGVFQFLQNKEIIDQLVPFYQKNDIQQASDFLLARAHRSWLDNSSIIDDITFILIFLNYNDVN